MAPMIHPYCPMLGSALQLDSEDMMDLEEESICDILHRMPLRSEGTVECVKFLPDDSGMAHPFSIVEFGLY